ncbi:hypothetical protein GOV08_00725 [Candidatus Woesearchaeota archaeon]|nr:hypothetical protein [Candidatus Woesearchaeota archaeon]
MKLFNFSKRGALNLSINAIVFLIIAIVFLGLALTFTRKLLVSSEDKLLTGIENVDISNPADSSRPIIIDGRLEMKSTGKKSVKISYYNRASTEMIGVKPAFDQCVSDDGLKTLTNADDLPTVGALAADVPQNSETRYQVTIRPSLAMSAPSYICNLVIASGKDGVANLQVPFTVNS